MDLTRSGHPALWLVTWDPSQPTATRPLALQKDGTWFTYGYDITKNICEVFGQHGYIRTAYSYAPFGAVTESGDVTQPLQWSSEHYDSELDLIYYNYRHYSPSLGRFLSRDPIAEQGGLNLYAFVKNKPQIHTDWIGTKIHTMRFKKGLQVYYGTFTYETDEASCDPEMKNFTITEDLSDDFLNYLPLVPTGAIATIIKKTIGLNLKFIPDLWFLRLKRTQNIMYKVGPVKEIECQMGNSKGVIKEQTYNVGYHFTTEYVYIGLPMLDLGIGMISEEGSVVNSVVVRSACCCK